MDRYVVEQANKYEGRKREGLGEKAFWATQERLSRDYLPAHLAFIIKRKVGRYLATSGGTVFLAEPI